jgi:hypothetical protein
MSMRAMVLSASKRRSIADYSRCAAARSTSQPWTGNPVAARESVALTGLVDKKGADHRHCAQLEEKTWTSRTDRS